MENSETQIEFPQPLIKQLLDKSNEKRKIAVREIEQIVKQNVEKNNPTQIRKILDYCREKFIYSNQSQSKKGGLLAFSAISIAIASNEQISEQLLPDLITPLISCLKETDPKIRFAACESLYNVIKTLREIALSSFNDIFKSLVTATSDMDEDVKRAAQTLDRILKDVVTESMPNSKYFNLNAFMPLFCEKLKAVHPGIRQMLISWIVILDSIPNINLIKYLPSFMEELFSMLGDSNKEISNAVDKCLTDFTKEIKEFINSRSVDIDSEIIEILVKICNKKVNSLAKFNALMWIQDYLSILQKEIEIPNPQNFTSALKKAILLKYPIILCPILNLLSDEVEEVRKAAKKTNDVLLKIMEKTKDNPPNEFIEIMPVLKEMLIVKKSSTAESALIWMKNLLEIFSHKLLPVFNDVMPLVIEKLQDSEESVIQNVIDVLGIISSHEAFFPNVIEKILENFHSNKEVLNTRMQIVITKLCTKLDAEKVYMAFAEKLLVYQNVNFISSVVQTFDLILLTNNDLQKLRNTLKNLKFDELNKEKNTQLFEVLYKTWTYNPVSTLTLCFLCQYYELAYNIIISFAEQEIDVDMLIQIAKLINLLESPIFVYLRLQLLESNHHPFLLKCLYGLMMLLPQGKAFNALKQRLKNIKILNKHDSEHSQLFEKNIVNNIDKKKMMQIFFATQNKLLKAPKQ